METSNSPPAFETFIERLPLELLARIFEIILRKEPYATLSPQGHYSSLRNLALVSVRWRWVALSTPTFWRHLAIDSDIPKASTILTRAGRTLSLSVSGDFMGLSQDELVIQSIHRWKEVGMYLPEEDSTTGHRLTSSAPNLRRLTFVGDEDRQPETGVSARPTVENLFDDDAPSLEVLNLSNISIPWTSRLLTNLRVLALDNLSQGAPTVLNLLHIFRQCPGLIHLQIEDVVIPEEPPWSSVVWSDYREVELEALKHLCLRLRPSSALGLILFCIFMPSCISLELGGGLEDGDSDVLQVVTLAAFDILGFFVSFPVHFKVECTRQHICCSSPSDGTHSFGTFLQLDVNSESILRELGPLNLEFPDAAGSILLHLEGVEVPEDCFPKIPNITALTLDHVTNLAGVIGYLAGETDGFLVPMLEELIVVVGDRETQDALVAVVRLLQIRPKIRAAFGGTPGSGGPSVPPLLNPVVAQLLQESRLSWRSSGETD